jgi:hypothetical protein
MRAIQVTKYGGPDVLRLRELPDPEPGDVELLVQAVGGGFDATRWTTRGARTRTCRAAAPAASCCSPDDLPLRGVQPGL